MSERPVTRPRFSWWRTAKRLVYVLGGIFWMSTAGDVMRGSPTPRWVLVVACAFAGVVLVFRGVEDLL